MAEWHKVQFNVQNIVVDTGKAVLIQMPHKSEYDGFKFWHPSKLVRDAGGKGYFKTFSFTDDFKFKLLKYGKGRYNKYDVIDEIEIDCEEMMNAFKS